MKFDKKYLQVLGIALSFPSSILVMAWGTWELIKRGVFSKYIGWGIFVLVIFNYVFLIIRYAFIKRKE